MGRLDLSLWQDWFVMFLSIWVYFMNQIKNANTELGILKKGLKLLLVVEVLYTKVLRLVKGNFR